MTTENFCYWLKGHLELNPGKELSLEQLKLIEQHLALVFEEKAKNIPVGPAAAAWLPYGWNANHDIIPTSPDGLRLDSVDYTNLPEGTC